MAVRLIERTRSCTRSAPPTDFRANFFEIKRRGFIQTGLRNTIGQSWTQMVHGTYTSLETVNPKIRLDQIGSHKGVTSVSKYSWIRITIVESLHSSGTGTPLALLRYLGPILRSKIAACTIFPINATIVTQTYCISFVES